MAPRKQPLHAQLSPFLRGVVFGLFLAGSTYQEIADEVEKADGTHPCQQTVADTIRRVEKNGGLAFDGERAPQAGRPRHTDSALDRQILRLVFQTPRPRCGDRPLRTESYKGCAEGEHSHFAATLE